MWQNKTIQGPSGFGGGSEDRNSDASALDNGLEASNLRPTAGQATYGGGDIGMHFRPKITAAVAAALPADTLAAVLVVDTPASGSTRYA